jgi:cyclophilin family peptidyl-prolyl cis-trans isomerase
VYNEKTVKIETKREFDKLPQFKAENPQVFFDLAIGNEGDEDYIKERVVFELFADVPKTCENFRGLCTGEYGGVGQHYKGNKFHRVISGFMAQGGDTTKGNGTGGVSIYGEKFADEGIWYPHTHKGVLSMANAGKDTNGSQFFICFGATPHLNKKHTIFGRVIHNYNMIERVEQNKTGASDKPIKPVTIVDCGELKDDDKMAAGDCDFLASYN